MSFLGMVDILVRLVSYAVITDNRVRFSAWLPLRSFNPSHHHSTLSISSGSKMKQTFLSNSCSLQHETPSPLPALIQYAFYFHYFLFDFCISAATHRRSCSTTACFSWLDYCNMLSSFCMGYICAQRQSYYSQSKGRLHSSRALQAPLTAEKFTEIFFFSVERLDLESEWSRHTHLGAEVTKTWRERK